MTAVRPSLAVADRATTLSGRNGLTVIRYST